jgi:DNA-binding HxlR family transcriptional regulator
MRVANHEVSAEVCRQVGDILGRLGDKWTVLIMVLLSEGSKRFSELDRLIGTVSQKMLAQTLRGLERDGYITRRLTAGVPPRVDYELTDLGREVLPMLMGLAQWALAQRPRVLANREIYDGTIAEAASEKVPA